MTVCSALLKCGLNDDDTYMNAAGSFAASPVGPTDSVPLPLDK
jgi:hypothetical protein